MYALADSAYIIAAQVKLPFIVPHVRLPPLRPPAEPTSFTWPRSLSIPDKNLIDAASDFRCKYALAFCMGMLTLQRCIY